MLLAPSNRPSQIGDITTAATRFSGVLRAAILSLNILVALFALYTLQCASELDPTRDLVCEGSKPVRGISAYLYWTSFGRASITLLLVCLVLSTGLIMAGYRHRAARR